MALVFFSSTLSATHSHQHDVDTHGTCNLCATAHTVAQITQSPAQVVVTQAFEIIEPAVAVSRPRTISITRHFTRPPPANVRS
jgi:hypothetical protein